MAVPVVSIGWMIYCLQTRSEMVHMLPINFTLMTCTLFAILTLILTLILYVQQREATSFVAFQPVQGAQLNLVGFV
jgi:hypothetical protein